MKTTFYHVHVIKIYQALPLLRFFTFNIACRGRGRAWFEAGGVGRKRDKRKGEVVVATLDSFQNEIISVDASFRYINKASSIEKASLRKTTSFKSQKFP